MSGYYLLRYIFDQIEYQNCKCETGKFQYNNIETILSIILIIHILH